MRDATQKEKDEMKRLVCLICALALCGAAHGAQDTDILPIEVRNPKLLEIWLEANAADAESRLASVTTNGEYISLINLNDAGTSAVYLQADKADDAGDYYGIVATDGSGLAIQSDATSKGTLATKVTISSAGGIAAADAITLTDANGAAAISSIAASGAYDATVVLDADAGEDNTDTWIIESEAADNDLSFVNHTTELMKLSSAGILTVPVSNVVVTAGNLTVGLGATIGQTLGVTGVATFTAESVHNLGIDADYITVDAAAGIDTKSAGTLVVGESTATKVEIADAGVETEVQGTLDVIGGLDVNEDVTVDLDASDEEIAITQSSASGTADVPLIMITDARTGATANSTNEATLKIDAQGTYGISIIDGGFSVEGASIFDSTVTIAGAVAATADIDCDEIDSETATALEIGKSTATSVVIADASVDTDIEGPLNLEQSLIWTTRRLHTQRASTLRQLHRRLIRLLAAQFARRDLPTGPAGRS